MHSAGISRLREHLVQLTEEKLWALMVEYFRYQEIRASTVHGTGEHGMDVVAFVSQDMDILSRGYNILIQAKTGNLTLDIWRKKVLYQMLESPYFSIQHTSYDDTLARRLLLVVTGTVTLEARRSISEFNQKHHPTIECWDVDDILYQFDRNGFGSEKLEQITGVGFPLEEVIEHPPVVGNKANENGRRDG